MMNNNSLTPELDVSNLDLSLSFYRELIGFTLLYSRPAERFAMLELEGARLMLQEAAGPVRRFRTAPLERPYGRAVNFQIQVSDVDALYRRVHAAKENVLIPLEEKWYQVEEAEVGQRQFVVADPDGFLLRFFSALGSRREPV